MSWNPLKYSTSTVIPALGYSAEYSSAQWATDGE
jgi:hypothetical protein